METFYRNAKMDLFSFIPNLDADAALHENPLRRARD